MTKKLISWFPPGDMVDKESKCTTCGELVEPSSILETCMGFCPYEDETGQHHHDTNYRHGIYECPKCGSKWTRRVLRRCPNDKCDWKG